MRTLIIAIILTAITGASIVRAEPPATPAGPIPVDGAIDVGAAPSLCASVSDSGGLPLDVRFFARDPAAPPREEFTLIALPDTQYYSQMYPDIFLSQTEWIVENREALNIKFVAHLGDIVQIAANEFEWVAADAAMSLLDDPALTELQDGIPFGLSVGNHDQTPNNQAGYPEDDGTSTTLSFNQWFGPDRFQSRPYYGGYFGVNNDNSYQLFSASGMDFIVIHHEFDDTALTMVDQVLPWTDQVLKEHRDRRAILVSHALLCTGTVCPSTLFAEWSTQGQLTYDALKDNENLFLMLCGHAATSRQQPRRTDVHEGHAIHTFLANYQRIADCPFRCGEGWLRIVTFAPADNEIRVQTYSPWLDAFRNEPCSDGNFCHEFTLPYDMDGGVPFEVVGSVSSVPSGTDVCVDWTGLAPGADYEWYVDVDNGSEWTRGPRWSFTSSGQCALAADCDDGDPCTVDACDGSTCSNTSIPDCCAADADCDDGNYCTTDACVDDVCTHTENSLACSDGDPCTVDDVCAAGVCGGASLACDDGNACTADSCLDGACRFDYQPQASCCAVAMDCDDGNPCTTDTCDGAGGCVNLLDPGCCVQDFDCDDGDVCTVDRCPRNRASMTLDGADDHVILGSVGFLGQPEGFGLRQFTLETWFIWDGTGETGATSGWRWDNSDVDGIEAYPLITKGHVERDHFDSRNVNYFFGITESGLLAADFEEHSSGPAMGTNHAVYGSTPVTQGVWHHAAATYDGQCWQLYLDGVTDTDGSNCPGVPPNFDSESMVVLGSSMIETGLADGHFGGRMDEARIWSRALSAQEISENRLRSIDRDPHLAGRFSLDEVLGVTMQDDAENGHLGSVFSAELQSDTLAPLQGGACENRVPVEVAGLVRESYPEPRWAWLDQPGMNFDVVAGSLSELKADTAVSRAVCAAGGLSVPRYADGAADPAPGEARYYLVRSVGDCISSPYGQASDGAARIPDVDCP